MFVDQTAHAAGKSAREELMVTVRNAVDADAKSRAQIEADAKMAEGDLDRVLAGRQLTLEQAHEILHGLTNFNKDGGAGLGFTIDNAAPI